MPKTFVVDASVCLKLLLEDEVYSQEAVELFKGYRDSKIKLISPNIIIYELANAIRTMFLKNKTNTEKAITYLKRLLKIFPNIVQMDDVVDICLKNALKYNISVYDASYITLAIGNNITLVTADDKLVKNVSNSKLAISLKDIRI